MAQASRLSIQVTSLGFMERLLNIIETNKHPLIAIAGSEGAVGGRLRFHPIVFEFFRSFRRCSELQVRVRRDSLNIIEYH